VTEYIKGEEGALHAMTGLIQFEEHEVYDLVRRLRAWPAIVAIALVR
jgi:hypothetical protein